MNSATISIKTEKKTKTELEKVSKKLGMSVGAYVNRVLEKIVREKALPRDVIDEISNKRTIAAIKRARENRKKGLGSPIFDNAKDAIAYLEKQGI